MFYLSKDKITIVDGCSKVVGFINGTRFTQSYGAVELQCDKEYRVGFEARELEQLSELIQKSTSSNKRN